MRIVKPVICAVALMAVGPKLVGAADATDDEKKPVWSTIDVQLYGYIKLDAAWDSSTANPGDFIRWVDLEPLNPHDSQFSMTANQTRVGLKLEGPDEADRSLLMSGRIEIDFYGGGASNKPNPMLRLAYADFHWRKSGWHLLAGQAADVISPLFPSTINYSVQWWAGNIGYRRPQIRVQKEIDLSDSSSFEFAGALTRDIGSSDSVFTGVDSGTDSGVPGVQGRVGWSLGQQGDRPIGFGLSGHWNTETVHLNEDGDHRDFDSWSVNLDLKAPLADRFGLLAEAYTGVNLAQYLGCIGQSYDIETGREVGDRGGWMALEMGPFGRMKYWVGISLSDVDEDDIEPGDRSRNAALFWNGVYSLGKHARFGLELSYWETEYKAFDAAADSADDFRTQFAAIYSF